MDMTTGELTRDDLRARYGVDSEFVRVKELAKITGIAPTTIYTRIREGAFPLPVRRVGDMPLVRVDHLLAWLNGPSEGARIIVRIDDEASPGWDAVEPATKPPLDRVQAAMERALRNIEETRARRSASPARGASS